MANNYINGELLVSDVDTKLKYNNGYYNTTDEIVVGKWIDGENIYRKVFTGYCESGSFNLDNTKKYYKMIEVRGYVSNNGYTLDITNTYNGNTTSYCRPCIVNNRLQLDIHSSYDSLWYYEIVVDYTRINE